MKRFLFFQLFFFLISTSSIHAQFSIQGTVLDSLNQPIVGANVVLLQQQDSVMQSFSLTDDEGYFTLRSTSAGTFLMEISSLGYGTFMRTIELKEAQKILDLGEVSLNPTAFELEGAIITESFIPIIIKKDTIEYNANAFKTKPNAVVEDLLKKLPGIEVTKDGTIKAQGEEVENILVDGKEFFEDDPKIASKNIPADLVDKVQVYDQDSEIAAFTGIDDGQEEKTINLKIKEGKNKGWFGKLEGAYGLDNRYNTNGQLNRFNKKMQFSLLANGNNISEQAFDINDYIKFMGGIEEMMQGNGGIDLSDLPINLFQEGGTSQTAFSGLNLNYDFNAKTSIRSNYFYNQTDLFQQSDAWNQAFLNGMYLPSSNFSADSSRLHNHRAKFKIKHQLSEQADIQWQIKGTWTDNQSNRNYQNQQFNATQQTRTNGSDKAIHLLGNWATDVLYRKKFKRKGRFMTARLDWKQNYNEREASPFYQFNFLEEALLLSQQNFNQFQTSNGKTNAYKIRLNYTEPIGKGNYLSLGLQHSNTQNEQQKDFFDVLELGELQQDNDLSTAFQREFIQNEISLSHKIDRQKFDLTTRLAYQKTRLENLRQGENNPFQNEFSNWLPSIFAKYAFSNSKQLRANYQTNIQVPAIELMQPISDNANPNNLFIGNPALDAEYNHEVRVSYTSFNQFYFRSFFTNISLVQTSNKIIYEEWIDDQFRRLSTPQNEGQAWNFRATYNFDFRIKELKVSLDGNARHDASPISVNTIKDRTQYSAIAQEIAFSNSKTKKIEAQIGYELGYTILNYQSNVNLNRSFLNHAIFLDIDWFITPTWTFSAELEQQFYPKQIFLNSYQLTFLDGTISKSFKDHLWTFYLKGHNLFNQEDFVERQLNANQLSESLLNQQGRYILLGIQYKIRSFGK